MTVGKCKFAIQLDFTFTRYHNALSNARRISRNYTTGLFALKPFPTEVISHYFAANYLTRLADRDVILQSFPIAGHGYAGIIQRGIRRPTKFDVNLARSALCLCILPLASVLACPNGLLTVIEARGKSKSGHLRTGHSLLISAGKYPNSGPRAPYPPRWLAALFHLI